MVAEAVAGGDTPDLTADIPGSTEFGRYALGLSDEEEARAERVHADAVVWDLLSWGPVGPLGFTAEMSAELRTRFEAHGSVETSIFESAALLYDRAVTGEFDLRRLWDDTGITVSHFPVPVGRPERLEEVAELLADVVGALPWLRVARTAQDVRDAHEARGHAYYLQCQPTHPLLADLRHVDRAHELGLRALMLTYNDRDLVGVGCTEPEDGGLTDLGRQLVDRLNDLGVIVDTAHCGRMTTLEACEVSQAPVVATHTAAQAILHHDRGKGDDEFEAIAATGGVIGVVTVPFFLGPGRDVGIDHMLDHIDHIARLVGPEHVAIGSDWPLTMPAWLHEDHFASWVAGFGFREEHRVDGGHYLDGFADYRDWPTITRGLVARGYRDDEIAGIIGGNALRVFELVCG